MMNRCFLAVALAVALSACGVSAPTKTASNLPPEEAVAKRAVERWEHIIAKDFKSAYGYLTPGTKMAMLYENYASRLTQAQIRWTGVKVLGVKCDESTTCKAEVLLDITVHAPGVGQLPTQTVQYEDWLDSGGEWYYLPQSIQ